MKTVNKFLGLIGLVLVSFSFSQCATTMKLETEPPTIFTKVYTQNWVAGVKGGGSGINIFIETKDANVVLDSVFFRGKITELTTKPANKQLFIGRILLKDNTENLDIVKTTDDKIINEDLPFELKEDECVVSYQSNGKTKYFKITDIKEKPMDTLPMSAPPNKN